MIKLIFYLKLKNMERERVLKKLTKGLTEWDMMESVTPIRCS